MLPPDRGGAGRRQRTGVVQRVPILPRDRHGAAVVPPAAVLQDVGVALAQPRQRRRGTGDEIGVGSAPHGGDCRVERRRLETTYESHVRLAHRRVPPSLLGNRTRSARHSWKSDYPRFLVTGSTMRRGVNGRTACRPSRTTSPWDLLDRHGRGTRPLLGRHRMGIEPEKKTQHPCSKGVDKIGTRSHDFFPGRGEPELDADRPAGSSP
jgi:hypothetical protein